VPIENIILDGKGGRGSDVGQSRVAKFCARRGRGMWLGAPGKPRHFRCAVGTLTRLLAERGWHEIRRDIYSKEASK
jgi:hypothetical protein